MFAKVFAQIFDSSISEDYIVRHVFMDLLVLADREGIVDMTLTAISRRTNVPPEVIQNAINKLLLPDPTSRSDSHEGCRIAPLDNHRDWGWYIVNFSKYRDMRDEEARKSYFREYQRTRRAKDRAVKDRVLTDVNKSDKVELLNDVTHTEVEVISDVDAKAKNLSRKTLEEIYEAYPRRIGKEAALKAIERAIRKNGISAAQMLVKVKSYAILRAKEDPQFTPHPATWFNQGRYEDMEEAHGSGKNQGRYQGDGDDEGSEAGHALFDALYGPAQ